MVKEIIRFHQLHTEVQAWEDILRDTLHGFSSLEEERRYQRTMDAILREIVSQVTIKLNNEQEEGIFLEEIKTPVFFEMMNRLLVNWENIRNVQRYIARSLKNL